MENKLYICRINLKIKIMTLGEKLAKPFGGLRTETLDELLIIVDGYAEDFGRWLRENDDEDLLISELLEIFIKEKGL